MRSPDMIEPNRTVRMAILKAKVRLRMRPDNRYVGNIDMTYVIVLSIVHGGLQVRLRQRKEAQQIQLEDIVLKFILLLSCRMLETWSHVYIHFLIFTILVSHN